MGRFSQGIFFSRRRRHVCVRSDGATRRDVSRCPCVVSLTHNAINKKEKSEEEGEVMIKTPSREEE